MAVRSAWDGSCSHGSLARCRQSPAGLGPSPQCAAAARRSHRQFGTSSPQGPGPAVSEASSLLLVTATRVSCRRRCSHARAVLLAAPSSSAPSAPPPSSCQTWPGDRFWGHSYHPALPKPPPAPGMQTHRAGEDPSPAFGGRWCLRRGCLLACFWGGQRSAPPTQSHTPTHGPRWVR